MELAQVQCTPGELLSTKKGSTNYLITASVIKVIGDLNICILLRQRDL